MARPIPIAEPFGVRLGTDGKNLEDRPASSSRAGAARVGRPPWRNVGTPRFVGRSPRWRSNCPPERPSAPTGLEAAADYSDQGIRNAVAQALDSIRLSKLEETTKDEAAPKSFPGLLPRGVPRPVGIAVGGWLLFKLDVWLQPKPFYASQTAIKKRKKTK